MKQVLVRGGGVAIEEVPAPVAAARQLLVRVAYSSVSVGTELAGVRLSGLPLYRRALKQPQHARRVLEIARDQGFRRTFERVRGRLAAGLPSGYSAAGVVVEVGDEVEGFAVGDRVACAGAGIANHAELIAVPVNLAVLVPDGLPLEAASSVTLGSIALQGVRRASPTLGETIGVIGLGIIGQLVAQLLRANGCRVVGTDVDPGRVATAIAGGMDHGVDGSSGSFAEQATKLTDGFGLDAVIVTAATSSSEVMSQAFRACRKKGRVVLIGDVGLELKRADLYDKELDFFISTSYGPGRYDPQYEIEGRDYPIGYVRWTENRNLGEYVRLLAEGRISLAHLPAETYEIDAAPAAYTALGRPGPKPLLVTLAYPERSDAPVRTIHLRNVRPTTGKIRVAVIGAGNFAEGMHIPNLAKLHDRFELRAVMSRTGATAKAVAARTGAAYATTDIDAVLSDGDIDLVIVTTRHDSHAELTLRALTAGKHVLVEKPLALNEEELAQIEAFYEGRDGPLLMTGFNRRFSPAMRVLRSAIAGRQSPLIANYRMNAGYIPPSHWVHGAEGGGRNIGEACHIYDLFNFLTGTEAERVDALGARATSQHWLSNDNFVASIGYADGSVCTLTYTAFGHRDHPKERMEVFADGVVASLDDYRSLVIKGPRPREWHARTVEKGHLEELAALADCLNVGCAWPISLREQLNAMRIAFDIESRIGMVREDGRP